MHISGTLFPRGGTDVPVHIYLLVFSATWPRSPLAVGALARNESSRDGVE